MNWQAEYAEYFARVQEDVAEMSDEALATNYIISCEWLHSGKASPAYAWPEACWNELEFRFAFYDLFGVNYHDGCA